MLYLSVSSLRDYLACPKRYWWKTFARAVPVVNEYVIRGQIVHNAIEKCSNLEDALEFAEQEYSTDFLSDSLPDDVRKMIKNYYSKIEPTLDARNEDTVETTFKLKWSPDAFIVGKIDRMSQDKTKFYDWKTSFNKPNIHSLHDPQFYVYHWAIQRRWGVSSTPYYGHLMSGELFRVDINDEMWYNVKYLIDQAIDELLKINYYPRVAGYQCGSCFFKDICWSEF